MSVCVSDDFSNLRIETSGLVLATDTTLMVGLVYGNGISETMQETFCLLELAEFFFFLGREREREREMRQEDFDKTDVGITLPICSACGLSTFSFRLVLFSFRLTKLSCTLVAELLVASFRILLFWVGLMEALE